jgi:hypothetical protein
MESPKPKYWPPDYAAMFSAAFRYQLFSGNGQPAFLNFPEWLAKTRILASQLSDDHLDDLRLIMHMIEQTKAYYDPAYPPFPGIRHLLAVLGWEDTLFPWFAGILRARQFIGEIAEKLIRAEHHAIFRACLAALVLMDDADAAAAVLEVHRLKKPNVNWDWDSELSTSLWLIDQRMGTSYLAQAKLLPPKYGRHIRRAVMIGDLVRGGIPTDNRRQFQQELAELVALGTPFDQYPTVTQQLLPTRFLHHWGELADWESAAEGNYLLQKGSVSELYRQGGLESAKRYLDRRKPQPSAPALTFTRAVEQFAGRGWDAASIEELLRHLQPQHPPLDLETALELDIHMRLPLGVVEAIFEQLITQFPLYGELYQRYAVQLLLRSNSCDAKAASLHAKGDALRSRWKTQWVAGFQIPMMALTVSEENNHPDARLPYDTIEANRP